MASFLVMPDKLVSAVSREHRSNSAYIHVYSTGLGEAEQRHEPLIGTDKALLAPI